MRKATSGSTHNNAAHRSKKRKTSKGVIDCQDDDDVNMTLSHVPQEILQQIFEFIASFVGKEEKTGHSKKLSTRTTLLSASQTCKRWRTFAFSMPTLWRGCTLHIQTKYQRNQVRRSLKGSKKIPKITSLAMHLFDVLWFGCDQQTTNFMKKYHTYFPNVTKVWEDITTHFIIKKDRNQ
jgi:hypothetical protein